MKAQAFLAELDTHPQVGGLVVSSVDCKESTELHADQVILRTVHPTTRPRRTR